jgi:hypothetical protein
MVYHAGEEHAGKHFKCTRCGQLVQIPTDSRRSGEPEKEPSRQVSSALDVEALCAALNAPNTAPDDSGRRRAAEALGNIGDVRVVGPLCTALDDFSYRVRRAAAEALGKIGDASAVEPLLTAAIKHGDDDDFCRSVTEALARIGRRSDILPSLINALEASRKDTWNPTRKYTYGRVLQGLGWYPDNKNRVDIVTESWRLGVVLGFPEAIDPAVKALFESPGELESLIELRNTAPHSSLTLEIADLIVIASSYESRMKGYQFWNVDYSVEKSNAAVGELCRLVSPITTNILHLVKNKKTKEVHMSDDDGRSWIDRVSFGSQSVAAERELERRAIHLTIRKPISSIEVAVIDKKHDAGSIWNSRRSPRVNAFSARRFLEI